MSETPPNVAPERRGKKDSSLEQGRKARAAKGNKRAARRNPRQRDLLDEFTANGVNYVASKKAIAHFENQRRIAEAVMLDTVEQLVATMWAEPLDTAGSGRPQCREFKRGCPHPGCIQLRNEQRSIARKLLRVKRVFSIDLPPRDLARAKELARQNNEI